MTAKMQELSVLAYANNFTLWHYNLGEVDFSVLEQPKFFNSAADMLRTKDVIIVNSDQAPFVYDYVVTGNAGGDVTVAKRN